jgi:hypothetical protein
MARRKKTPEEQEQENAEQNAGSDDTFGLPEIEYEPINREQPASVPDENRPDPQPEVNEPEYTEEQPVTNTTMERDEFQQNEYTSSNYNYDDDEGSSPWPKILGIAAILIIIAGAVWFFAFHKPQQEKLANEKAAQEERDHAEALRIENEREEAQQRLIAENEQRKADSIANASPAAGSIETLNGRTGRYYVVIASAIDGDLIMDYAKKLSQNGVNAKIIPPYNGVKFYRLTVAEGDTFAATQETAEELKSEYTSSAWVIKY